MVIVFFAMVTVFVWQVMVPMVTAVSVQFLCFDASLWFYVDRALHAITTNTNRPVDVSWTNPKSLVLFKIIKFIIKM